MADYDAIVLGAGAAGLFCGAIAAQNGARVLVLDHADEPGKKILISGGGRCNFTNVHTAPDRYLSANPHFAKSALSRYTAQHFIALVDAHGIAWHEKTLGQLFCDGRAHQIVDLLLAELAQGGGVLACGEAIRDVAHADGRFAVTTTRTIHTARQLVIATGGPSIPKMGASTFAYELARQFGLKVVQPRPALVPLTLGGDEVLFRELSGVSAPVIASAGGASFREAALFTHRGLSGPAILQASSYWHSGQPLTVNFLPEASADWLIDAKRTNHRATLRSALREALPQRLADVLADRIGLEGILGALPDKPLRAAQEQLARWAFHPNGTEGYAKAEVTAGGISTAELSSKTMAASKVPGLYVIGEGVDVTGWLGGYNFQWAWASGHAAGLAIAETARA
ncbi:MAG: NAD(P)/FAD-dependent oxidoreductase [Alteraurantiacibacter sp.]